MVSGELAKEQKGDKYARWHSLSDKDQGIQAGI